MCGGGGALPDWPLGDLNLPRALFTEKAFAENKLMGQPRLARVLTIALFLGSIGAGATPFLAALPSANEHQFLFRLAIAL